MKRTVLSCAQAACRPFVLASGRVAVASRSFHASVPARISYEEWVHAKPHCHHASLWKVYKPTGPNGTLLTGDHEWAGDIVGLERNPEVIQDFTEMCQYLVKVLNTMNDSPYKRSVMERTEYKLKVLQSGKTQQEMEDEFGFGPLEELHAVTRGELELIKSLGKDWFDVPAEEAKA